jgi:hypothetical protein
MLTTLLVLILIGILWPEFLKGLIAVGLLLAALFSIVILLGV